MNGDQSENLEICFQGAEIRWLNQFGVSPCSFTFFPSYLAFLFKKSQTAIKRLSN